MEQTAAVEKGRLLTFERLGASRNGLRIVDHVERRQCSVETADPVVPREVPEDAFYFPVDRGVSVTTSQLALQHTVGVYVRNHAGWMVDELSKGESREFPADEYSVDFSAPIKLYANFESAFEIEVKADDVRLSFEEPVEVLLGARSHHKRPAATITTTDDPEDVMRALSYLGSALKTTTPERSYPTLRGHPPTIELGDTFHAPPVLERPETDVRIEVPRDFRSIFVVAPLAYYLAAEVVPGDTPRIVSDSVLDHELDDPDRGFEGEVERVLKQSFFLDCVTRTEGYYPVDLHERNAIEGQADLDFAALYDAPLGEQLDAYLDVPYSVVEPHLPQWKLNAHVGADPEHVETLPFVVNDLAVVRTGAVESVSASEAASMGLDGFMRGSDSASADAELPGGAQGPAKADLGLGDFTRSSSARTGGRPPDAPDLVRVGETDALEQTYVGPGVPIDASKALMDAFHNRLGRTPTEGDIGITVICNSDEMEDEGDIVDEVYGSREDLPFDVAVHRFLETDELREVLEEQTDFLHYIGHIDQEGFECPDGTLDARELDETGVDAFFLNACSSYEQGVALIEAGAIAGAVTVADVINSGAERIGKTLAKLLNRGFPIRPALDIARKESIMGGYYLVIGDGGLDIAQANQGVPALCQLENADDWNVVYTTYPTDARGIGSMAIPYVGDNDQYYLASGDLDTFEIDREALMEFLSLGEVPIIFNKQLRWSSEIRDEL